VFCRDGDLLVFGTLQDAAGWIESVDVLDGEYEALFTLDGTVVRAGGTADGPVILTVSELTDVAGLQRRLRQITPLRREWEARRTRRRRWLARQLRGDTPPTV